MYPFFITMYVNDAVNSFTDVLKDYTVFPSQFHV